LSASPDFVEIGLGHFHFFLSAFYRRLQAIAVVQDSNNLIGADSIALVD
jgi:hypothetical protein